MRIVTQPKEIKLSIKMIVEFNIYLISPLQQHILSRSFVYFVKRGEKNCFKYNTKSNYATAHFVDELNL